MRNHIPLLQIVFFSFSLMAEEHPFSYWGYEYIGEFNNSYYYHVQSSSITYPEFSNFDINNDDHADWLEAEQIATFLGGNLLSITSEEENNFIMNYLNSYDIWNDGNYYIGLNRQDDSTWQWDSEEDVTFTNWGDGYPEDNNNHFTVISTDIDAWRNVSGQTGWDFFLKVQIVYGCTDEEALNYDSDATENDGCNYIDNGDYSLHFDGVDDYVDLGPTFIGYQNEYSIAAAFYADSYEGAFIYHNRNHDMGSYLRLTSNPNNENEIELNFYVGTDAENCPGYITNTGYCAVDLYFPINLNEWYDVVGSYDGQIMKLFVNGILVDSIEFSGNQYWSGDALPGQQGYYYTTIGDNHGGGYKPIDGKIDDLVIFSRALTDEEILSLNFSELFIDDPSIRSFYKFNAAEGNILYDHSGNQNHGTIYGADWINNFIPGDLDLNNFIDIADIIILVEYILEPEDTNLTDFQIELCDLDTNGYVDITDIIILIEIILEN